MNMDVYQEFTTIPYGQQHDIIYMVSIYGPRQAPGSSSRAPVDLVCVLDKSGSMKGPKLELVQKTMTFVVEQLQDSDRLALVTFDTEVSTISPLQNMTKKGKSESLNALQRIHAGSSTNLSGGIIAALKILQKRETVLDVTSVMVFTDGQANQGIKNTDEIVQCLQLIMPSIPQCSIFTFGFGTDTNATMLRAIADSGNGLYYYIATLEDVPSSFADCLGGLLSVSARNVQVDLCLEEGCSLVDVLSTYKRTGSRNNSQVSLVIGDLYSEEHKDLLYLINLPPLNSPTSKYIVGKAILTYLCVESDKNERLETELSVSRSSNEIVGIPNVEVDKQRNRLTATMALQHAVTLGDQGNYQQARKAITDAIGTISKSTSKDEEFCTQLVDDLQKAWLSCDPRMYQCGGSQVMNTVMQCHQQQRSPCNSMHSSLASYSTTSKQLMVQAAQRSLGLGIPFEGESGNSIGPSSFRCTPPPAAKPASATLPIRPSSSSHHTPKLTPRAPTNLSPSSTLPHRKISTSATTTSHSSAAIRSSSAVQPSKKQDQSPKPKAASSSTVTRRVTTRASPRVEANPSPKVSTRKAVASS